MSKAEELAKRSRRISEILMSNGTVNTLRVIKYCIESETELRRLAQVEAEHAALLKAISDAEPVAWMIKTGHGTHLRESLHKEFIAIKDPTGRPFWTPLYTLNGIKKP